MIPRATRFNRGIVRSKSTVNGTRRGHRSKVKYISVMRRRMTVRYIAAMNTPGPIAAASPVMSRTGRGFVRWS
ncbi:hypothetical protein CH278_05610 [Rhodococcus sp. 05-2254-5]|nr:hypothetical protein CH278_05610 [Rhodococcus sp. 05-2254-5]OZE62145.1 hypothetical protein CH269_02870 [Rhodococcus sp. 05-2254-1]